MPILFEIDTSEAERGLVRVSKIIPDHLRGPLRGVLRAVAKEIQSDAAQTIRQQGPPRSAPGRPPARGTGALLRSVKLQVSRPSRRRGERASVVVPLEYGFMLESGTRKGIRRMEARPFLVPARERHREAFVQRVREVLESAIRKGTS